MPNTFAYVVLCFTNICGNALIPYCTYILNSYKWTKFERVKKIVWSCDQWKTSELLHPDGRLKRKTWIYLIKHTHESHIIKPGTCIKKANQLCHHVDF